MKIGKHIRGKSDTLFEIDKKDLDNIQGNLKLLRDPKANDTKSSDKSVAKKKSEDLIFIRKTQSKKLKLNQLKDSVSFDQFDDIYNKFLYRLFMFKKQYDEQVFYALSNEKNYLNTLFIIIKENVNQLRKNRQLTEGKEILRKLNKFEQLIDIVIQIKPSEYYREIKAMLLNEFEETRIDLQHYIEKSSKSKRTSKIIVAMSQTILYLISRVSYRLDYYSLTMNCLIQRFKSFAMYYIEGNAKEESRHISNYIIQKRLKKLNIIEQFIFLSRVFTQEFYDHQTCLLIPSKMGVSMNNFSSSGRYIMNNFIQMFSKSVEYVIKDEGNEEPRLSKQLLIATLHWKNYLNKLSNVNDIKLDKYFKLYFNLKLVSWKNSALKIEKSKKPSEICRMCEQAIPIQEYILHICYCKEQKIFYDQMRNVKKKLEEGIRELTKYKDLMCGNNNQTQNSIFPIECPIVKELKKVIRSSAEVIGRKEEHSDNQLLTNLIKIYQKEADLPLDFYEKNPYKFPQVVSLIYLTIFFYITNKQLKNHSNEINEIFCLFFSGLTNKMIYVEYLLSVLECKTKSNTAASMLPPSASAAAPEEEKPIEKVVQFDEENIKQNEQKKKTNKLWNDIGKRSIKSVDHSFEETKPNDFTGILDRYKSKINISRLQLSPTRRRKKEPDLSSKETFVLDGNEGFILDSPVSDNIQNTLGRFSLNPKGKYPSRTDKLESNTINTNTSNNNNSITSKEFSLNLKPIQLKPIDNKSHGNINENNEIQLTKQAKDALNETGQANSTSNSESKLSGFARSKNESNSTKKKMPSWEESPLLSHPKQNSIKKSLFGNKNNEEEDIICTRNSQINYIEDKELDSNDDEKSEPLSSSFTESDLGDDITLSINQDNSMFKYLEINDIYNSLLEAETETNEEDKYYYLKDNTKGTLNLTYKKSSTSILHFNTKPIPKPQEKAMGMPSIDDFQFIKKIAEGGYGRVDIYKKKKTGDLYAIKSVNINTMKNKNLSSTLKKETLILNEINSEYVVKCYYIFNDDQNYYYVMEYMPGGDLLLLLNTMVLPQITIQLIVAETTLSLVYLHSKNIIHRDIKPENILISKDAHFKITDFGLSESDMKINKYAILHSNKGFDQLENSIDTKTAVGTLNYMAPEMLMLDSSVVESGGYSNSNNNSSSNNNEVEITFAVDWWALGILIYELYTFKVPFYASTPSQIKDNIVNMKTNWSYFESDEVKQSYSNLTEAKDLISKFILKNPDERWGDDHLDRIKNHSFFNGFNWDHIRDIKDNTVRFHVAKNAQKTSNEIKEEQKLSKKAKPIENTTNQMDINKTSSNNSHQQNQNETDFYCERVDNLYSKSQDVLKEKFKKEELAMNEDNTFDTILDDL